MNAANTQFISPTSGRLDFERVVDMIAETIENDPHKSYKLIIGADSSATVMSTITTVVIIQRARAGGRYFYTRSPTQHYANLADRIFAEAISSITLAQELRSHLKDRIGEDVLREHNEIHVDVGRVGPTKELVEAVTGMLKGYDFEPVIKPDAFAAFSVADRHVRSN